jgi:hypothetical protein
LPLSTDLAKAKSGFAALAANLNEAKTSRPEIKLGRIVKSTNPIFNLILQLETLN